MTGQETAALVRRLIPPDATHVLVWDGARYHPIPVASFRAALVTSTKDDRQ